jgi:predicted DCC family thiol-disulfide oxidoreductase YuxK
VLSPTWSPRAIPTTNCDAFALRWSFDGTGVGRVEFPRTVKPSAENLLLYDDQCSLCVAQMRTLKRLDWFNTISLLPMSSPRVVEIVPALSHAQLMEAIRCVTSDGRMYSSARCFRYLGMRIPVLVPLALILWVPGVIWVAEIIYRRISRNRYFLSRIFGCGEVCAVPLPGGRSSVEKEIPNRAGKR